MTFSSAKIEDLEKHLSNNPYLSEGGLPGPQDASVFLSIKQAPKVQVSPNTHYWWSFMNTFSNDFLKKWVQKSAPKKQQAKKQQGDDLFDDDDSAPKAAKKTTPPPQPPAKKKKEVIAKSIVVFDVKVEDTQTDLDALSKKVLALQLDGLVWNNQPKKLDVAYGIQKLQMGCVIEDAKVLTDDIFDQIQAWEQVQSVDMVSMQKL